MVEGLELKESQKKKKIESKFIDGLRVTDENIINIVEKVLIDFNNDIVSNLKKLGSKAVSFHTKENNIIDVTPERKELGYVGIPNKINSQLIENTINQNQLDRTPNSKFPSLNTASNEKRWRRVVLQQ